MGFGFLADCKFRGQFGRLDLRKIIVIHFD